MDELQLGLQCENAKWVKIKFRLNLNKFNTEIWIAVKFRKSSRSAVLVLNNG